MMSVSLPVVGAALTVAAYVGAAPGGASPAGPRAQVAPLLWGALAAIVAWLALALPAGRYATVRRGNAAAYAELDLALRAVEAQLPATAAPGDAAAEAWGYAKSARDQLDEAPAGLPWLSGVGYVTLWATVHRAQEAFIESQPDTVVVDWALQYELRLKDARIADADALAEKLRRAVAALSPACAPYLVGPPPAATRPTPPPATLAVRTGPGRAVAAFLLARPARPAALARPAPDQRATLAPSAGGRARDAGPADDKLAARLAVRRVVHAVNEFRDRRRAGLVRARNQLLRTVAFAGLLIYVLLALAILNRAPPLSITAAAAFYLVGASVGLFNRLYLDSQADTATEEDFGLSVARLLHTPLFSGLAAIGGVLLAAMLPASLTAGAVSPPGADTAAVATVLPTLDQVFNLQRYPFGFIVAAVFGLTPSLLISRLAQPIEQYKRDLRSTETQQGSTQPGT